MVGDAAYIAAITSLWDGTCTVLVREGKTNTSSGRTESQEVAKITGERCRISYKHVVNTAPAEEAQRVTQIVMLFIARTVDIPPGSKIRVTQNGVTADYEQSGEAAVYSYHKEVPLALFGGWA